MEEKILTTKDEADTRTKVSDVQVIGTTDSWHLLTKASSKKQGWMKSSKAYQIDGVGCVLQVTTQQGDQVAEALVFIPDSTVVDDSNGGRKIVAV